MKTQLPEFLSLNERANDADKPEIVGQFRLSEDCIYLQGHFPSAPILPGVTQLDWVVQLASQYWSTPVSIQRVEVLKFNDMILPGAEVDLVIQRKREDCITFSYKKGDQALSSGRLVF
ncbi:hydroxymyristoyl-ACP dehydratase [Idiomarina sp. X4]|uniref:ApeI family dehydratase n=1 Tax=unclassified Idiomarina TaxID=2614829 RepID=UPI000C2888F3|nr:MULTISPECIES: hydroxymyristoyl-ACP dehydratase [unclassified Idiomarina]ATZ73112.1 hydroxymyristoyl-ACP dehydratase [Idiomarina sp. X4]RXS43416.1 hydroxymyristoyl-ACP dehydratase [Idiomarina sp. 29L]